MKRILIGMSMTLLLAVVTFAQTASTSTKTAATTSADVSTGKTAIDMRYAATITGQLQGSLNAAKAKVGDEVVLKMTKSVKENGQTLIEKGSRLIGRVTEVKQNANGSAGSQIGVVSRI